MRITTVTLLLALLTACGGDSAPEEAPAADEADEKAEPEKKVVEMKKAEEPAGIPAPADVAAPPEDATKTESGLAIKTLSEGPDDGETPDAQSTVKVHYTGWTTDGKMFDSSVQRGQPASFPLTGVIAGWTEGLQLMSEGDKARLWIPEELAYKGMPGRPAGMLVFDVELLEVKKPMPAPDDVAAPPANAQSTESGLKYVVLSEGEGDEHPAETDIVSAHYTGWTTDGKMFDSSVMRGQPGRFPLNRVIAGWTEGLQLMTKGASYRFWIPEDLAYKGQPGRPAGMLVFDVELLDWQGMPKPPTPPAKPAAE